MRDKILITGGSGYLGSVLAGVLLDKGYTVTVFDNLMYNQLSLLHLFSYPNFKFIQGDVRDKEALKNLVKENDVIIPLAAIVGMPACEKVPELAVQVNFEQIRFITSILGKSQKIIIPNTNSQYGSSDQIITEESPFKPLSLYAETKCNAENEVLEKGNGIALRLATVFGVSPRMRTDLLVNDFVYRAKTDGFLVLFESSYKRNYIHVQDIAYTFLYMIENYESLNNETFNVGLSEANLSKLELAIKIKQYIPDLVIVENEFKKDFDQRNYIVSNEKLEKTGWQARFSLDYGVQQLIQAYQLVQMKNSKGFTNL